MLMILLQVPSYSCTFEDTDRFSTGYGFDSKRERGRNPHTTLPRASRERDASAKLAETTRLFINAY